MPTASFGTALPVGTADMYGEEELEIRQLELERLHKLEKQSAQFGPRTDPGVLIEIQELYNKYPEFRRARPGNRRDHELDFLANAVAAGLQRLTALEQAHEKDLSRRLARQLVHDLWMVVMTALLFMTLLLVLVR